jgi:hypothetical protein
MKVITIGRSSDNDVKINDPYVGRYHCQIVEDNGSFRLTDLETKNGTYVNGMKIKGEVTLYPTDIIKIGNTVLPWKQYLQSDVPTCEEPIPTPNDTNTQCKKRHGFITFWLWLMIICGAITGIYYFAKAETIAFQLVYRTGKGFDMCLIYLIGGLALINALFAVALLQWKKWGFWTICISAVIALIINTAIGLNPVMSIVGGMSGILILWVILQIKKDGIKCWNNLE